MLIGYRFTSDKSFSFGLAVKQWFIDNEPRIFVLLPQDKQQYCEVEVIYPTEYEWCSINNQDTSINFKSKVLHKNDLPDLDEETDDNLYCVWDDGASKHPERAAKLYEYFQSLL